MSDGSVDLIPTALRDAYLARLGVDAEPPSADALVRLHQAHVETIPWETAWIHLGEGWGIDPAESARRIAATGRGGYCFHLNGAFSLLLGSLGYRVTRHAGAVHGTDGPVVETLDNHLVLTVGGLPEDTNPGGVWYVDVGLGDALHHPLPLLTGRHRHVPFHLTLDPAPAPLEGWHLTHDPAGAFAGMVWDSASVPMEAFAARHSWLSTSPDSRFVQFLVVQRRDATGVDSLRGLTLQRIGSDGFRRRLTALSELVDALGDVFGISLAAVPRADLAALWRRTEEAQEQVDATQGGASSSADPTDARPATEG